MCTRARGGGRDQYPWRIGHDAREEGASGARGGYGRGGIGATGGDSRRVGHYRPSNARDRWYGISAARETNMAGYGSGRDDRLRVHRYGGGGYALWSVRLSYKTHRSRAVSHRGRQSAGATGTHD